MDASIHHDPFAPDSDFDRADAPEPKAPEPSSVKQTPPPKKAASTSTTTKKKVSR